MTNRLSMEQSPYLLQHGENPIDWYPWGPEAFAKAKEEDKPIFLSIGYSTCHWCHAMAKESFEDNQIAGLLNHSYVSIKVDREERPDIDLIYMKVCQAATGTGGWPLTIIMTPDQKPFYAGTYFPKTDKNGVPGLFRILTLLSQQWNSDRLSLIQSSETITQQLFHQDATEIPDSDSAPSMEDQIKASVRYFKEQFDRKNGGFEQAPKFPTPQILLFLLHYAAKEKDTDAEYMVKFTLDQMYRGGIFDHIGGGFCRYSTDDRWLLPHFEKTLYDNALLSMIYTEAWHQTLLPHYAEAARRTLSYIKSNLSHPEGGFYSGQDADSEGEEGKFYFLTKAEILKCLGAEDGERYCRWYGITESGNCRGGRNLPNLLDNKDYRDDPVRIMEMDNKLAAFRKQRSELATDDKILTAWNCMAICAFAGAKGLPSPCTTAETATGEDPWIAEARKTKQFIQEHLMEAGDRLYLRYCKGRSAVKGQLADYAWYAMANLALYTADSKSEDLREAMQIAESMLRHFRDDENGGFYFYADDAEQLIGRPKELFDDAVPSGCAVAAWVLTRLAGITKESRWARLRDQYLDWLRTRTWQYPTAHTGSYLAYLRVLDCPRQKN